MRPAREITEEEENFRIENKNGFSVIKRDSIEPEPVGSILIYAFRITGYTPDCDGSLMAKLEAIDSSGGTTGWEEKGVGIYPNTCLVVTVDEWMKLFKKEEE